MAEVLEIKISLQNAGFTSSLSSAGRDVKKFAEGSLGALQQQIRKLNSEKLTLVDPAEIAKVNEQIENLAIKMTQLQMAGRTASTGLDQSTRASANAGHALLNLNYIIRDSPYFFHNFALGVMAVGNNINPFIDSLQRGTAASGGFKNAMKDMGSALMGGAGLTLALSLAVTAIQAFVFAQAGKKKAIEDTTSAIRDQIKELENASDKELRQTKLEAQGRILLIDTKIRESSEYKKAKEIEKRVGVIGKPEIKVEDFYTKEQKEQVELYKQQIALSGQLLADRSYELQLVTDIKDLEIERRNILQSEHEKDKKRVEEINEKIKEKQKLLTEFRGGGTGGGASSVATAKDSDLEALKDYLAKQKALLGNAYITEEEYYQDLIRLNSEYNKEFREVSTERLQFFAGITKEMNAIANKRMELELAIKKKQQEYLDNLQKSVDADIIAYERSIRRLREEYASLLAKTNMYGASDEDKIRFDISEKFGDSITDTEKDALVDATKRAKDYERTIGRIDQVANIAGSAISNAFLSGKNAIEAATQALKQFIVQLIVIQAIKGLFKAATGVPLPSGDSIPGMNLDFDSGGGDYLPKANYGGGDYSSFSKPNFYKRSGQSLDITGRIEAEGNKFVIDFEKAKKRYVSTKTY
jgi:hypothetical protein